MNKFVKSLIAVSVTSAVNMSPATAATYQVVEIESESKFKYTYAHDINNAGDMVLSATNMYTLPVIYSQLSDEFFDGLVLWANGSGTDAVNFRAAFNLNDIEDLDALKNGTPVENDQAWLFQYLRLLGSNFAIQKFGSVNALINNELLAAFDVENAELNDFARSTDNQVYSINNKGWAAGFGSAPYELVNFTNGSDVEVNTWIRDFIRRGFIQTQEKVIEMPSPEMTYGGHSVVFDVNDNYAVGYASVALADGAQDTIESDETGCNSETSLNNQPYDVCVAAYREQTIGSSAEGSLYELHAVRWTLNNNGDVVSTEDLGTFITPPENDTRLPNSFALAVNKDGVAVGYSYNWFVQDFVDGTRQPTNRDFRTEFAAIYKDGAIIDFTDRDDYRFSRAVDINDSGIAVGHMATLVNGFQRTKFFHIDVNSTELAPVFPSDFFKGSSSVARAINNNGIVVGEGEVETHNDIQQSGSKQRRRHGFMYDINTQVFTDLNSLLACDTSYTIVEAHGINDNNEIAATALISAPRRDSNGDIFLDSDGNEVMDEVLRAVKLQPTSGDIESCDADNIKVERQGAPVMWLTALSLAIFGLRRRR